ncbi:hypothetical protein Dsin_023409 [Dipteronia sinensis]|uniref:Uncharacterized protein n=1 Tax=Dipteronia sinensis TaxID=43782 RepID=A0AAE0A4E3_9ROSI|nr:hypothetical protein Dsin_023409 [Dipteronia sinensis]
MEMLFMQIFEKKNHIIEQVRHQSLLFDQQLAAKCLLDGIAPPSWFWSPSLPSSPSAPTEVNKEELISELLLPCPSSIPYTEIRNSNKAFDAGDRSSVSLQLPNDVGGAIDGIEKPDSSSASSPQDQRNATVLDINSEPFQSLARIQRSKSRQRALELRDSAKVAKSCLCVENDICAYSCLLNRSGISTPQYGQVHEFSTPLYGQVHESGLVKPAEVYNESCEVEEAKVCDFHSKEKGTTNYTGRITRSRISSLQPSSLRESSRMSVPTSVGRSSRGSICAYSCLLNRSGISTPQSGQVPESGLVKHAEVYNESCEVEEAKICDFLSKDKGTTNYTGRITRSLISSLQPSSLRESSRMGDLTHVGRSSRGDICAYSCLLNRSGISNPQSGQVRELVKPAEVYNESCEVEEAKICDFQSTENGTTNYTGRITRSRISLLQPKSLRESS